MIRPFTCVCMVLAGASGLYLYQAKHNSQLLDREIAGTLSAAAAARERSSVLRAEWTLLNDPERLAQLAGRFLALKTVTPGQFTSMAELDKRLPPVRPAEPLETTDEVDPVATAAAPSPASATAPAVTEPEGAKLLVEPAKPGPKSEARKEATAAAPKSVPPTKLAVSRPQLPPLREAEHRQPLAQPRPLPSLRDPAATAPAGPPRIAAIATRSMLPVDSARAVAAPIPASRPQLITPAVVSLPSPIPFVKAPVSAGVPVRVAPPAPAPAATSSVLGIARTGIAPPVPFPAQPTVVGGGG